MRNANRYGLTGCRVAPGRGRKPSAWNPDQVAGWLLEKKHFSSPKEIARILRRRFPDCADYADLIDPPREE